MHFARIVEGIIFVSQVIIGHYKLISIHTVGKLFGFYHPKGFCLLLSLVFASLGSFFFTWPLLKGYKYNPGHTLSVPKSARLGSSRGGGG